MKKITLIIVVTLLTFCPYSYGQIDDKISTIDFVQILNENNEEAIYYFQNNWKILRKMAIKKKYIHSFEILEVPSSVDAPFQLMLITTYLNQTQYNLREDHFSQLIKEKGELKLLNNKEPSEFRKSLFSKKSVRHWN